MAPHARRTRAGRATACLVAALAVSPAAPLAARVESQPPRAPTRLTEPQDDYADVSPDGRRVVFQSNRSGTWQLWLVNGDGTGLRRLTHGDANDRTPDWSPDGTRVVFSSDRAEGRRNLFVLQVGPDGAAGPVTRLVEHAGSDIHPRWSRDGRTVVFNRVSPAGEREGADVMLVDADGRNVRRVPLGPGLNTYAELTPDGARVIYRGTTRETRDGREVENSDVFSAAVDGSHGRRLTDDPAFDGWPTLSPDGRTIAFASRRAGDRFHVFLMPVDGGTPRQVTAGEFNHTQPAWSPDGRRLTVYRWAADRTAEIGHLATVELDAADAAPRR